MIGERLRRRQPAYPGADHDCLLADMRAHRY
jgi:hypothetical protein